MKPELGTPRFCFHAREREAIKKSAKKTNAKKAKAQSAKEKIRI
jgi:hypothetical protein